MALLIAALASLLESLECVRRTPCLPAAGADEEAKTLVPRELVEAHPLARLIGPLTVEPDHSPRKKARRADGQRVCAGLAPVQNKIHGRTARIRTPPSGQRACAASLPLQNETHGRTACICMSPCGRPACAASLPPRSQNHGRTACIRMSPGGQRVCAGPAPLQNETHGRTARIRMSPGGRRACTGLTLQPPRSETNHHHHRCPSRVGPLGRGTSCSLGLCSPRLESESL
jgi:hypothetical protein